MTYYQMFFLLDAHCLCRALGEPFMYQKGLSGPVFREEDCGLRHHRTFPKAFVVAQGLLQHNHNAQCTPNVFL